MVAMNPAPLSVVDILTLLSPRPPPLAHPHVVDAVMVRIPRTVAPRFIFVALSVADVTPRPRITTNPEPVRLVTGEDGNFFAEPSS